MPTSRFRRPLALLAAATILASLTLATVVAPAAAAKPKCAGRVATIVGTNKGEVIRGTKKADVIVAKGGHDRVYGRGGNDIICGNSGHDKLVGGPGNDLLLGQTGRDRHFGGPGRDRLLGGPHNDSFNGGTGNDACLQGSGIGVRVKCERPALAPLPVAPPAGPTLIPLTGILAVAYSDIDGLDGYSTGDVLIARLEDTNGDKAPTFGDVVRMGRYPTDLNAGSFGNWLDTSHVVTIDFYSGGVLSVAHTDDPSYHMWQRDAKSEGYTETNGHTSYVRDGFTAVDLDQIKTDAGSPSVPQTMSTASTSRPSDDGFIDVVLNY